MKTIVASIFILIFPFNKTWSQQNFDKFSGEFVTGYNSLHIPNLELSYVNGFKKIKSADSVQKEIAFFKSIQAGLASYQIGELSSSQKQDLKLIKYETDLNLERLGLEALWLANKPKVISTDGLSTIQNGKAWYTYLLKRWVSADVKPDDIYQFGLTEVNRVKSHIEDIRKQTGLSESEFYRHLNDSSFFISDPQIVQAKFEHTKDIINKNLDKLFYPRQIPDVHIQRGEAAALAQTPGYYDNNTFYYNLFNKPYNNRQIDWLFIHEAVPGHHYQLSISAAAKRSSVQKLFFYNGFAEGWGAYAEELGKELGAYKTPYDELGKWEWDIVRSVRVPLDVGINYYGWTDEQALAFWKKHIHNQDDIAMREIKRIKRWPAQVVTYKYGALQIMQWKETLKKEQGKNFSIKDFHEKVLSQGTLPLFIVKENVFKD